MERSFSKLLEKLELASSATEIEVSEAKKKSNKKTNNKRTNKKKTDQEYYDMVDELGNRYDIPLVPRSHPRYSEAYVDMMKLKEKDPEAFDKAMKWG